MRILPYLLLSVAVMSAQAPKTKVEAVTETLHGVSVTDPYRWLESQDSPDTRAWIDSQMKFTQSMLAKVPQRDRIHARLSSLMKIDVMSVPTMRNGRYFHQKRKAA